jgi:hypothetical protein
MTVLLSAVYSFSSSLFAQTPDDWKDVKGDHFIIYHQRGSDRKFPEQVLRKAESYYDDLADELGYSRRSDFWLWHNRCSIYLYPSKAAFQEITQQAPWSNGFAIPEKRTIVSYEGAEEFLDSLLPHELAHLIFRDFVGIQNQVIPLWLDEGLAMAQEQAKRPSFDQLVKRLISEKKWIPLDGLVQIKSMNGTSTQNAAVFYAQAQSLVRFLLKAGAPARFIQFCRDLRDGSSLEEGLRKNYPQEFPSIQEFEKEWIDASA